MWQLMALSCADIATMATYSMIQSHSNFGMWGLIANVITHSKFCDIRFSGFKVLIP